MKKYFILFFLLFATNIINAEILSDSARVSLMSGVYIFSYAQPIAPYTILGEVSFSGKGDAYHYTIGGISILGNSEVYYPQLRNSLIAQAVLANREVEGIIIKGKSATMIKFVPEVINKDIAIVSSVRGLSIFLDSEPLHQYEYIQTKNVGIADETSSTLDNLSKKAIKLKKDVEAMIIYCDENYIERADYIKFK